MSILIKYSEQHNRLINNILIWTLFIPIVNNLIAHLATIIFCKVSIQYGTVASSSNNFISFVTGNTLLSGGIAFGIVKHLVKNGTMRELTDAQIAFKTFFMTFCASSALFVVLGSMFTALRYCGKGSDYEKDDFICSYIGACTDVTWLNAFPLGLISNAVCYAMDQYKERDSGESDIIGSSGVSSSSARGMCKNSSSARGISNRRHSY